MPTFTGAATLAYAFNATQQDIDTATPVSDGTSPVALAAKLDSHIAPVGDMVVLDFKLTLNRPAEAIKLTGFTVQSNLRNKAALNWILVQNGTNTPLSTSNQFQIINLQLNGKEITGTFALVPTDTMAFVGPFSYSADFQVYSEKGSKNQPRLVGRKAGRLEFSEISGKSIFTLIGARTTIVTRTTSLVIPSFVPETLLAANLASLKDVQRPATSMPPVSGGDKGLASDARMIPSAIAVADEKTYVVDGNSVRMIDSKGIITSLLTDLPSPSALVATEKTLYIATNTSVLAYDLKTGKTTDLALQVDKPSALVLRGSTLFVADSGNDRVVSFNTNTRDTKVVANVDDPAGLAFKGMDLFVSSKGSIVSVNLASLQTTQLVGPSLVTNPSALKVAPDGSLYLIDGNQVLKLNDTSKPATSLEKGVSKLTWFLTILTSKKPLQNPSKSINYE